MLSVRDSSYHLAEFPEDKYCCVHRKGGPLAVTDANLLLGRLVPEYFPKIFGKTEKEPLDVEASRTAFEKLGEEINATQDKKLSLDDIVYGFVALLCPFPPCLVFRMHCAGSSRSRTRRCAGLFVR
jgi:hypothetical protein